MDKCIKVLIPTGEILLERNGEFYSPVDGYTEKLLDYTGLVDGEILISSSSNYTGWVDVAYGTTEVYDGGYYLYEHEKEFPVIAQYGDEFPA